MANKKLWLLGLLGVVGAVVAVIGRRTSPATEHAHVPERHPGIRSTLEDARRVYGTAGEENTYRPDLYPTSYQFKWTDLTVSVTPMRGGIVQVEALFRAAPAEAVEATLERLSGVSGWTMRPTTDPSFKVYFPLFDPAVATNVFYACAGAVALVQHQVGLGELVVWIQTDDYQKLIKEYRNERR